MIRWKDVNRWWKGQKEITCFYDYEKECFVIFDKQLTVFMEVSEDYIYQTKRAIYAGCLSITEEYDKVVATSGSC